MLHGADIFTLSDGTACTVEWTRPEAGADITCEEQQERMRKFAKAWLDILAGDCRRLLDEGRPEAAEARWRGAGVGIPPPWLGK